MKPLVTVLLALTITGCAELTARINELIPDSPAALIALNTTQTVTSALQLKDNYLSAKQKVAENIDVFSADDRATLTAASQDIELFYHRMVDLSKTETRTEFYVRTDEFLNLLQTVRQSADSVVQVLDANAASFDPETRIVFYRARSNYMVISQQMDRVLASGSRRELAETLIRVVRSASKLALAISISE